MGDHIYYQCSNGKIARRDYKSVADLKNALKSEINPDNQAELQRALDRRMEAASEGQRTSHRGILWMQNQLDNWAARFSWVSGAVEFAAGIPQGELAAADKRILTGARLVQITLSQQKALKAQFELQEEAERVAELQRISEMKAAGTYKPKRKRKARTV